MTDCHSPYCEVDGTCEHCKTLTSNQMLRTDLKLARDKAAENAKRATSAMRALDDFKRLAFWNDRASQYELTAQAVESSPELKRVLKGTNA